MTDHDWRRLDEIFAAEQAEAKAALLDKRGITRRVIEGAKRRGPLEPRPYGKVEHTANYLRKLD